MIRPVVSALFVCSAIAITPSPALDAYNSTRSRALENVAEELAHRAVFEKENQLEHWKESLDLTEQAYAAATNDIARAHLLGRLAERAFYAEELEKANAYAEQALATKVTSDGFPIPIGDNVHQAHLVLGKLALLEGDAAAAAQHLLDAGRTPGSPALDSFGPNMGLAKLLLERGDRDDVVEYLRLCGNFWKFGVERGTLGAWIAEVQQGGTPDFGANLVYGL